MQNFRGKIQIIEHKILYIKKNLGQLTATEIITTKKNDKINMIIILCPKTKEQNEKYWTIYSPKRIFMLFFTIFKSVILKMMIIVCVYFKRIKKIVNCMLLFLYIYVNDGELSIVTDQMIMMLKRCKKMAKLVNDLKYFIYNNVPLSI